jgi:Fe-S oxidoreductase
MPSTPGSEAHSKDRAVTLQKKDIYLTFRTKRERVKEFEDTGADLLITACAYCKDQFSNMLSAKDQERIKDLTEFDDERT